MKILIVTQYFWPENFRINDIALGLLEKGHEVTVLTGIPNYPQGDFFEGYSYFSPTIEDYNGIKIVRSPLISRKKKKGLRLILNYLSFAISASFFGPLLCWGSYDKIFVFEISPITVGIPAIVMKVFKKAPIYFWVADLWPETLLAVSPIKSPFIIKAITQLVKFIYRHCDMILVTSKGFIEKIEQLGVPREKIEYWPQWAENFYKKEILSEVLSEDKELPKGFRIIFAGNIGKAQSFETIIDAAEKLREYSDIHWIIIGDGSERTNVFEEIKRRKLTRTIHLLGSRPANRMSKYYSLADALLITLKRDPLFSITLPGKIQAYLACSRPIIASIDGEGRQVIEEAKCGLTCAAGDSSGLAEKTLELYRKTQKEREEMGESGNSYYLKYFKRDTLLTQLLGWMT